MLSRLNNSFNYSIPIPLSKYDHLPRIAQTALHVCVVCVCALKHVRTVLAAGGGSVHGNTSTLVLEVCQYIVGDV